MPPTERCPFRPSRPAAVASLANFFSSSSLGEPERDVHPRPAVRLGVAAVEAAAVDLGVELRRLPRVLLLDRRQPALLDQPLHHQPHDVDREHRRRVVHRLVLDVHAVVQHRRQRRRRSLDHVVADDHQRDSGRREVLLRSGVNQRVLRDVDRAAEHVGRGVGDQRHGADVRQTGELGAEDRVVGRHVHVGRARDRA